MPQAFIIMQIGNSQLDAVCQEAIVPAIEACGMQAKRVDKHNAGGLLKSEIIKFLQESDVLIADITNERPNCYLEIGYAMGIDKFRNLILTVRKDHFPDHPNHKPGGPKVHFDLGGYDILRWSPEDVPGFRVELEKRIRRRQAILTPLAVVVPVWDEKWIEAQRSTANAGLADLGTSGFMEAVFALRPPKLNKSQQELNEAARVAPIETFGWPIAVYLGNRDEFRPKPRADGIVAEIKPSTKESYDFWALKRTGDFYWVGSLFEDKRRPGEMFFNTRIVRVTETLLYCARLYSALGVDRATTVHIAVRHGGLKGRALTSSSPNRHLGIGRVAVETESVTEVALTLDQIEANLVSTVKKIVEPLLALFDFFTLSDGVYEDIVNKFVNGQVT